MARRFTLEEDRQVNGKVSLSYKISEQDFPWMGDNEERIRAHYEEVDNHYVLFLGKKVIGVEHKKEEAEKRLYQIIKSHFNRIMSYNVDRLDDRTSLFK